MTRGVELVKLQAENGATAVVSVVDHTTLVILNALSAPVYVTWGTSPNADPPEPSATNWDAAAPGESYISIPIPADVKAARLKVVYPGSPPSSDVQAVVSASPCAWPPFVGPLA